MNMSEASLKITVLTSANYPPWLGIEAGCASGPKEIQGSVWDVLKYAIKV